MSLLTNLETEAPQAWAALEADGKYYAALLWSDAKAAATAGKAIVLADVSQALPGYVTQLKQLAGATVARIEQEAATDVPKVWSGTLKFAQACADLWSDVQNGFLGPALDLSQATVESLIQAAAQQLIAVGLQALLAAI